jgi:hypothetical protein
MWHLVRLLNATFRRNMSPPFRVEEIPRARINVRLFLEAREKMFLESRVRPVRRVSHLSAICEPIV